MAKVTRRRGYHPYTGLLTTLNSSSNNFTTNDIQQEAYTFDALGNLVTREDDRQTVLQGSTNVPLSETFGYDGDNRVTSSQVVGQAQKSYQYDALGNFVTKAGLTGSFTYGGTTGGPHAVTAVNGWTYSYDANGNRLQQKQGTTVLGNLAYSAFNKPTHLDSSGNTVDFTYGADRDRLKQVEGTGRTLLYVQGPLRYEVEKLPPVGGLSTWTHTHYVTANGELVALYKSIGQSNGSTETPVSQQTRYLHTDHLGSLVAITDESKAVVERFSFDAWGKRRNAVGWTDATGALTSNNTVRGYTGHEELDTVGLVHMNGRVYDPVLGRFTSADPNIQYPGNPQSYNRYCYVNNNPLSFTDPTGFGFFDDLFDFIGDVLGGIADAIATVVNFVVDNIQTFAAIAVAAIPGGQWASTFWFSNGSFAAVFSQGFASGLIASGGDLQNSAIAGITAVGFNSLHGWNVEGADFGEQALKAVAHGTVGGLSSVAQGGSFQSGFLSAGATQAFSSFGGFEKLGVSDHPVGFAGYAENAAVAGIVGGTASVIGGGDFRGGAVTGAFSRLFNDLSILGDSRFKSQIQAARNRLPALDTALNEINANPRTIYLRQGAYGENEFIDSLESYNRFDTGSPTIIWDASSGLKFSSGVQSATLGLFHEVSHALGWIDSPEAFSIRSLTGAGRYDTVEESRVIRGPEALAARFLGEPERNCHNCGEIVRSSR